MQSNGSNAWVGDILCWNQKEECWEIYNIKNYTDDESFNFDDWDTNLIPDSICVIPACHTDNNKARWLGIMSSEAASSVSNYFYSGQKFLESTLLIDDLECFTLFNNSNSLNGGTSSFCYATFPVLVGNMYTGTFEYFDEYISDVDISKTLDPVHNNELNIKIYTYNEEFDDYYELYQSIQTHSVYDKNEKNLLLLKNKEAFKYKNSSGELNPIYDMDGYKNCEILKKYVYNSSNLYESGFFTILDTCNNYTKYTGIPESDWYIPAAGECEYIFARINFINHIITLLSLLDIDNKDYICTYKISSNYWTSTLYSADEMIILSDYGFAMTYDKTSSCLSFYIKQY